MFLRHDDIPEYVRDGVCDLGIVGVNALEEALQQNPRVEAPQVVQRLGFGRCRLSFALPHGASYTGPDSLAGKRIATSYPAFVAHWLNEKGVDAETLTIKGSVELAPSLEIADAVCDLVSSGQTLEANGLVEVETILESEGVLVRAPLTLDPALEGHLARLLQRVAGVLKADRKKYVMMHAPRSSIDAIRAVFPGLEEPTVLPLGHRDDLVAVHAVTDEIVFWETMERLKEAGASSILVVPIEKIVD